MTAFQKSRVLFCGHCLDLKFLVLRPDPFLISRSGQVGKKISVQSSVLKGQQGASLASVPAVLASFWFTYPMDRLVSQRPDLTLD